MLNPMVQSDLVTYMGGTIVILFMQATIVEQKSGPVINQEISQSASLMLERIKRLFSFLMRVTKIIPFQDGDSGRKLSA